MSWATRYRSRPTCSWAGGNRQTAFFVANPGGGTALRIWNGDDHVELRAGSDGARFSAARDGEVVFQMPEIADFASTETCSRLRGLLEQHERERVMEACRQRVPGEDCRVCLGRHQLLLPGGLFTGVR